MRLEDPAKNILKVISEDVHLELPNGNRGEVLKVSTVRFGYGRESKGEIRQWAAFGSGGALIPSSRGVRFPLSCAAEIATGLMKMAVLENGGGIEDKFERNNENER